MCPNEDCTLIVQDGKVFCRIHEKYLKISHDWDNCGENIPMKHVLYVAFSNGKEGEILIDEEV